jgi:ribonuclease E
VQLAPSEAALLAAVEGAVASGDAETLLQSAADQESVQQLWLPVEENAPAGDEPVADSPTSEAEALESAAAPGAEPEAPESAAGEPDAEASADIEDGAVSADGGGSDGAALEDTLASDGLGDSDDANEPADGPSDDTDDSDDDTDDNDTDDDTDDNDTDASDEEPTRRRRRRRGGRRRRRGGGGDSADDGEADQPVADSGSDAEPHGSSEKPTGQGTDASSPTSGDGSAEDSADDADDTSDEASSGDGDGQRRRRRRRRRRGEDSGASPDDPAEVVVRVREPANRRKATSEQPAGIEGSTRLEAKRQRRREGREAGRRRAPILSEAEFLARRESVARTMVIRQREDLTQIAVLEDDILVEHYVDRDSAASLIGNVYLGRVQNVLPSMEAAFIDIGRGRNAVLYAGEVDWESFGAEGQARKVEKVLKSGQTVLVQVTKDPVGAKGARLTNHVSIPGRYIVYAPGGHLSGISRKLPDTERRRLKDILADLVPESASVIVRTAAEGASEDELVRDVNRLKAQWEDIEKKVKAGQAPVLLYGEPDLTLRIVRDLFTEDFSELLVAGNEGPEDAYDAIEAYVAHVAPHLADRLKRWAPENGADIFAAHRIDEQIAKALERKVFLPSGGSLVIDRTEAMTVIDVNTGKFTGTGGNLEATVTSNNLEAAEEIVRQLRLRDIGGIIVIDFIDMVLPSNRELLLRRLVECLGRDRTRHQVAEVTSLGLIQMTRKKIGTGLLEAFSTECEVCHGRGYEIHDVPVESQKQADGGARERVRPRSPRRGGGGSGRGGSGSSGSHGSNGSGSGGSGSAGSGSNGNDSGAQSGDHSAGAPAPVG